MTKSPECFGAFLFALIWPVYCDLYMSMQTQDFDAIVSAPFGAVGVRTRDDFLVALELLPITHAGKLSDSLFVRSVVRQIQEYLNKPNTLLDIPVAVHGTPFQKRVWQAIANVPVGQTISYGDLAAIVGSGPRAVANACGANPLPLVVPCHRVLAKNGLGGFMQGRKSGLAIKAWLLSHEQQK
jgi:methylated-DNA-[protein]-cysteine S-methyltransferase